MVFSGGGAANSFAEFPIYSATNALVRTVENYALKFRKKFKHFCNRSRAIETKMLKKLRNWQKSKAVHR